MSQRIRLRVLTGNRRVSPPHFTKRRFVVMPSQFPNHYLRADGATRVRMLPQLFWPDWTGLLLPVAGGFHTDLFRATLSVLMTIPDDPSPRMDTHAGLLNPRVTAPNLTTILQGFDKLPTGSALTDVLMLLCRITEHLEALSSLKGQGLSILRVCRFRPPSGQR